MPKLAEPKDQLRLLARVAIVDAKGDNDKAYMNLNNLITKENNAALERALCEQWRPIALRQLLATHFHELRAEGKVKPPAQHHHIDTTNYDRTTERPKTWASQRVEKIEERKRSLLDTHFINGVPLGDCTAAQLLDRAERNEREAIFLRRIANGIPADGKVRDYITDQEADAAWQEAQDRPLFQAPKEGIWAKLWPWLMKGIKNAEQLAEAQDLAHKLEASFGEDYEPARVALDGLARAINEYEGRH